MREPPNVPVDALHACLRERYDIVADTLEYLSRGYDYRAGVYRVVSDQGEVYLLKATTRPLYEPSCLVPRYLRDQGIAAVVAPLPTTSGALWTALAEWTVIVYPFLEGGASLAGMTSAQWQEAGSVFRRIHQVQLPPNRFPSMRREAFDPAEYIRWVHAFETQQAQREEHAQPEETSAARALRAAWVAHWPTISTALTSLERLAAALRSRTLPFVICHGDLHAANLLRDPAGHVFAIDWDEVMLAPKERDVIFVREPHAQSFWEGYGLPAHEQDERIDWMALTYFRWERVIQDLIEETQQALFTENVREDARMVAATRFAASFAAGGNVSAAYAAAAHLSGDLSAAPSRGSE